MSGRTTYVKLNVGGHLYTTSVATLTSREGMLCSMFSSDIGTKQDADGYVCIDRDGRTFRFVLDYLRDGKIVLPETRVEQEQLLAEARFFCLEDLASSLEEVLQAPPRAMPECIVPLVSSADELQQMLDASPQPVVMLTLNRNNNQFSYTGGSVENMFRNTELFDKLALKFCGKILFCKNTVCSKEICTWTFFAHGENKKEISCVTMVYSSERPMLKIEFPETRIYEEMLNTVLFAF